MTAHQPGSRTVHSGGFAFRSCRDMLRELGLFMWQRRRSEGTIPVCTGTWWEEWRAGSRTFGSSAQWWGSGYAEMQEIPLKCKKHFFHCDLTKKQVAAEAVESPSVEMLKTWLLVTQPALGDPALGSVLAHMISRGACQPQCSHGKKNAAVWNGGDTKQSKFCNLLKYFFQQWHCQCKSCLLHFWVELPAVCLPAGAHLLPKESLWLNIPVMSLFEIFLP